MVTPLTERGEIDEDALWRLISFLIEGGVHGIFVLGSTGEFLTLPWERHRELIAASVRIVRGRVPVCAGLSSHCLAEVTRRAAEAAKLGADIGVVLPPHYFRFSQDELVRFFTEVADKSPLPIVMYNIPVRTNCNLEPATVETLSRHPRIAGIKDTVSDMVRTIEVLERVAGRDDFAYLHGNELLALPSLLYGSRGMVPSVANFEPRVMAQAYAAVASGDVSALPLWQKRIGGLMRVFGLLEIRAGESTTLRLQTIKAVLKTMGLCGSRMAQLDATLSESDWEKVRRFVAEERLDGAPAPR
jgi:4-hydroxy-tetrahydrodipicolinate synthase